MLFLGQEAKNRMDPANPSTKEYIQPVSNVSVGLTVKQERLHVRLSAILHLAEMALSTGKL